MRILDNINYPEDLKKLNTKETEMLADEIRAFLIDNISHTGGHLSSNLGVVELTLALHKVFDFSNDRIVFDVGHQSYVHKLLTGRKNEFASLRKYGGISGFPKVGESRYDAFDTGHSSDSLSVALGMKRAFTQRGEERNVVALIGDGSFTGGMVYEAMNDAGHYTEGSKDNIIVVLNDNGMSISKNNSSISKYLRKLRISNKYINAKNKFAYSLHNKPGMKKTFRSLKNKVKRFILGDNFFENLGFAYYGPYDGHDISALIDVFSTVKGLGKPVIVHVNTVKGKGYPHAESNPEYYHGISDFNKDTGKKNKSSTDYSSVFGDAIVRLAEKNERVVAVTAAMPAGTGLSGFAEKFPERFYDVGICESHAVALCGGLAYGGLKPYFAVYSTFLQRGYDQLITDVALMKLPVVFCIDRAGIVGADGETHQGIFDASYLRSVPGLTVMSPSSYRELEKMLEFTSSFDDGPCAIRYPRGNVEYICEDNSELTYGKGRIVRKGKDITVVSYGMMMKIASDTCDILEKKGISCELIDLRFVKPVDFELISESVARTGRIVVIEDNIRTGGVGEAILSYEGIPDCARLSKAIPDCFVTHGSPAELFKALRLDSEGIAEDIIKEFNL